MFGPGRFEAKEGWRKLHNEEFRDLYSSPSILEMIKLKRMRWAMHIARMREKKNAYRLLLGKPRGRKPLVRPGLRQVENIEIDLREMGW
jgi:hypothetical protein